MMRLPVRPDDLPGLRAARWIRESTRGQLDRFGPDAQRDQQDRAMVRYRLLDTGIAWQVAHSGRTIANTLQFAEMLERAGRDYDVLVVGYVSRFARDLRTAVNARHDLHHAGAAILFADERLLSSDEEAWEIWAREAVEAEAYSRRLAKRIREGYASKRRRFSDPGGLVPYGFRRAGPQHLVEPDPETMPTAVRAYGLAASGARDAQIAIELGLTLWTVRGILRSNLYVGRLADGTPTRFPAPVDPVIVDQARAQRVRWARSGHARRRHRTYPLTNRGPLVCDHCGRFLKGAFPLDRQIQVYRHPDRCDGWERADTPAVILDAQVAALLHGAAPNPESAARIRRALTVPSVMPDRLAIARVDARLRSVAVELAAPGQIRAVRQILDELETLKAQRAALEATPIEAETVAPDEALDWLASLGKLWDDTTQDGRRALVVAIFSRLGAIDRRITSVEATPDAERRGLLLALPAALNITMVGDTGFEPVTSRM